MKTIQRIILLLLIFPQILCAGNPDSLLEVQIQKTTKYYREVKDLAKEVGVTNKKIEEYLNSTNSLNQKIDSLTSRLNSNSEKIEEIDSKPKEGKKKDFNWLDFLSNLFIEIAGAFVGAVGAIYVFYRQIKHDKQKEIEKKIEEQKENNFYLYSLIQAATSKVKQQRESLKIFYEEIDKNPTEIPLISLTPMQDLKRLAKVVDKETYYYSFLEEFGKTKESADKYRKITVSVDYLDAAIIQMEEILWKGLQFDRERKLAYKEAFENGMNSAVEIAKQLEKTNPKFSNTIFNYTTLYHKATQKQQSDFNFIQDNYVNPLKKELVAGYSNLPEARQILTNLKQLTLIFFNITQNNLRHTEPFKEFYERFEKALDTIEENAKELKEKNSLQQSV